MTWFQGEQQQRETDAQISMSSLQDELRLTQQAFHAKQDQLEGIRSVPAVLHIWLQSCQVLSALLWGESCTLHMLCILWFACTSCCISKRKLRFTQALRHLPNW